MRGLTLVLAAATLAALAGCGRTATPADELPSGEKLADAWAEETHLSAAGRGGAAIFATASCLNCHTYRGSGSKNLGAPDLTNEGDKDHGIAWLTKYVSDPSRFGDTTMPRFQALGRKNLHLLAVFLHESGESH